MMRLAFVMDCHPPTISGLPSSHALDSFWLSMFFSYSVIFDRLSRVLCCSIFSEVVKDHSRITHFAHISHINDFLIKIELIAKKVP